MTDSDPGYLSLCLSPVTYRDALMLANEERKKTPTASANGTFMWLCIHVATILNGLKTYFHLPY